MLEVLIATSTVTECDDDICNGPFVTPLYFGSVFKHGNVFCIHPKCEEYIRSMNPITSHAILHSVFFISDATIGETPAISANETSLERELSETVADYSKKPLGFITPALTVATEKLTFAREYSTTIVIVLDVVGGIFRVLDP